MADELLDIVDEYDRVIGQRYRSEIYLNNLNNFRVINAFLINDKKELWIPRRAAHKKLFPSCLDASVGGHVMSGESYYQAFERELQEELNIDSKDVAHSLLTILNPHRHNVSAHMHVYSIMTNTTPKYNQYDFMNDMWVSIDTLQRLLDQGEPTKGDLPALIHFIRDLI